MSKRLRIAGICLISGLGVEALTLLWSHPLAFVSFIAPGGVLILAGVLLYVWALLARAPA
jgi:predicted membrane channel-forming protein YqfA (hemolysin III family)